MLQDNGAEGDKELVVDCLGVIQEQANNALNAFDASGIQFGTGISLRGEVSLCTVDTLTMLVR